MKCHSTLDFFLYKKNPEHHGTFCRGRRERAHNEKKKKREKRASPITVNDYELYISCSFNAVYSLPRFVTIKYSHQHLCRPLLITHHNNKRSQPEIAIASLH